MAEKIPERKEVKNSDCWDLSLMFKNEKDWEELFSGTEKALEKYENYKGKLGSSFKTFLDAVLFDTEISRKLEKIYTYAHLKADQDQSDQHNLALYQKAVNLYTKASVESSFMTPEILAMPESLTEDYISRPELKEYEFHFRNMLRNRPHILSGEAEQILAMGSEMGQAPSRIFTQLDNADLTFGEITDSRGKELELSHGTFITLLHDPSQEVRRKAFLQYYEGYDRHKNTISTALAFSNKKDCFYARVRNFSSARKASLFSDNISEDVYDNLISAVRNSTEPLFKYLRFRKETLGLKELHFYDTYVPLIKNTDFHMTFEEAVDTCTKALAPLGQEYCDTFRKGLLGGWVDRYENKGKRSGAYSSGCYDSVPYILTNYREDNIDSVYTLIHEGGHSMHSLLSSRKQSYINHDYTIFVAEVASTFNETLLSAYLLDKYADDDSMKAYILNREIDNIRATLYRQTMFAEFEKITHELTEAGQPLTLEVIRQEYRKLLEAYFGDTIVIDDELTLEGLRIPHFYSAFYVYKYATGISAAIALAEKVLKEGTKARDAYLNFLGMGGSAFPLDELLAAGVDMRTPEPVLNAAAHFAGLVDEFIALHKNL